MKFERLCLEAFGSFTGKVLELASSNAGLDIVYGPNEAGKSTTLRAISGLLFGIPEQTRDNFLHAGKDLRIGATLSQGSEFLKLVRRKGRKQTLLDPDTGAALPDATLEPWLGGLDETLWKALYGLNHETLRQGAQALLAGSGAVGESLFDVGLGTSRVRRARNAFRTEAEALFTRKARTRAINQQLLELERARQLVNERSTSAVGYLQLEAQLSELQLEQVSLRGKRAALQAEKRQLERLLRWLPLVAQRQSYLSEREALGSLPTALTLTEVSSTELTRVLSEGELRVLHERQELSRTKERLESLGAAPAWSELELDRVEEVAARLGEYRKTAIDLPKREGECRAVADEVTAQLRRLGFDPTKDVESLRLSRADEAKLRRLAREKTQSDTKWLECATKLKRATDAVSRRKKELAALGEGLAVEPLEAAVMRAQKHVEQELQLQQAKKRLAQLRVEVSNYETGLRVYVTPGAALPERVLDRESIDASSLKLVTLGEQLLGAQKVLEQAEQKLRLLQNGLQEADAQGLPSVETLSELREVRDRLLFAGSEREFASEWLADLSRRQREADAYADRLFHSAVDVERLGRLKADTRLAAHDVEVKQAEVLALEQRIAEWHLDWARRWLEFGVNAQGQSQSGMRGLVEQHRHWQTAREESDKEHQTLVRLEASLAAVVDELSEELEAVGEAKRLLWESLQQFVARAEHAVLQLRSKRHERTEAVQRYEAERSQLEELQREQLALKESERLWRPEWTSALKLLALSKDAASDQVLETLDGLTALFHRIEEKRTLERRIAGMQRDVDAFARDVDAGLSRSELGAEVLTLPLESRAEKWIVVGRKARALQREQAQLSSELREREPALAHAEIAHTHALGQLQQVMHRAGVNSPLELRALEQRLTQWQTLSRALAQEEQQLVAHGDGLSLGAILEQVQERDATSVRARILDIDEDLARCETQLDVCVRTTVNVEQQLAALGVGAARSAEEFAEKRAELRAAVERYIRVKLASEILETEIERYRKEHQTPVLSRASDVFRRLTLGVYAGLDVVFDADDAQVLVCRRADNGREVEVAGLSDGARDQLYLSLRVASWERSFERGPRCPLVLDDILVHFDDARACAALEVLSELAASTQVLFFTHHSRIVEMAKATLPTPAIHDLASL